MKTKIFKIDVKKIESLKIKKAAKFIQDGKLVAFPTETVYGLGASAFNPKAIKQIFKVKKRALDNPLIVHVSSKKELFSLTNEVCENAEKLIKKFWPGPLTIIFKKNKDVPLIVTAGLDTVAVRMPKNKIALELIKQSNHPLVAPSANLSTKPSPTKAEHVINDFYGKIECIIDGGVCQIGIESTVIDLTSKKPTILRPGKITKEDLEKVIGVVNYLKKNNRIIKSPGLKYKHYSPDARVYLITNNKDFEKEIKKLITHNKRIAIFSLRKNNIKDKQIIYTKKYNSLKDYTKKIFSDFREADLRKIDVIIVQGVLEKGLGLSLMNRLKKASFMII